MTTMGIRTYLFLSIGRLNAHRPRQHDDDDGLGTLRKWKGTTSSSSSSLCCVGVGCWVLGVRCWVWVLGLLVCVEKIRGREGVGST